MRPSSTVGGVSGIVQPYHLISVISPSFTFLYALLAATVRSFIVSFFSVRVALKASGPTVGGVAASPSVVRAVQNLNAFSPILVTRGKSTVVRELHWLYAYDPILVTRGVFTVVRS